MTKLIKPDKKQCQAEKRTGNFMTLGGSTKMVRCTNKPRFIAIENEPGSDGKKGSMSLCEECATALVEQCGKDFATFVEI